MENVSGDQLIDGVQIIPLKQIKDQRGMVMHMLRCDAPHFKKFGEVYFSLIKPGVSKGWKKHYEMTQHFACPQGRIKLVIYDDREGSSTHGLVNTVTFGVENEYNLVIVPKQLYYSFRCISEAPAIMANCADRPHSPDEYELVELEKLADIYTW